MGNPRRTWVESPTKKLESVIDSTSNSDRDTVQRATTGRREYRWGMRVCQSQVGLRRSVHDARAPRLQARACPKPSPTISDYNCDFTSNSKPCLGHKSCNPFLHYEDVPWLNAGVHIRQHRRSSSTSSPRQPCAPNVATLPPPGLPIPPSLDTSSARSSASFLTAHCVSIKQVNSLQPSSIPPRTPKWSARTRTSVH